MIARRTLALGGLIVPLAFVLGGCGGSFRDFLHSKALSWHSEDGPDDQLRSVDDQEAILDCDPRSQLGFWLDSEKCIGCAACIVACREKSGAPPGAPDRRTMVRYDFRDRPQRYVTFSCMHCRKPTCVEVCPAGAISKGEDGIVSVDKERCIGCRYCRQACPYGAPHYTDESMDKCDCCLSGGVTPGRAPYCVRVCPTGALVYGTLDELAREEGCPDGTLQADTEPSFYLS